MKIENTRPNNSVDNGFVNLNFDKLDGYFVDLSAVIRERGRHTENITTSKLQCEVNE